MVGQSLAAELNSLATECFEVGFMPRELLITHAKDQEGGLVDIHNFNKFYSFQVDRAKNEDDSTIKMTFRAPKSAGDGFLLRLRAELSTSFSDEVQQGMRVSLINAKDGSILTDASSIDDNAGSVTLDYPGLRDGANYTIKYEFFTKQLVSTKDMAENQLSGSQTECKLPFITQQLLIQDTRLVKTRVQHYNSEGDRQATRLSNFQCKLEKFNNSDDSPYGEDGFFCERKEYTYSATSNEEVYKIHEVPFTVRGAKEELITYWYEMVIGYNMMVGNGLQVMLSRDDVDVDDDEAQFRCLYDKTCALAKMSNKNELKVDLILTSGEYKLTFFDVQTTGIKGFFKNEVGLTNIPLTFRLSSYPVLQNEERVNCPFMFMEKHFIQNKFINGMHGQRFAYSDKILMNVFNLSQMIEITPEVDSLIKIKVKEAFGISTTIVMCSGEDCLMNSVHLGTSEIMFANITKGQTYSIELGYSNSIIAMASFFMCPHIALELSMTPVDQALLMVKELQCSHRENLEADELLSTIFNSLTTNKNETYTFEDPQAIFKIDVDQSHKLEKSKNYEVISKKFILSRKRQLYVEIFQESYLQDLELYLVSDDASKVRAHLQKGAQKVDWSLYKGAKQLFVELEPGSYDLKVIQKLPAITSDLTNYQPACVSFQLRVVFEDIISKAKTIPNSFNYFGLLGPTGKSFGQMIYYCSECTLAELSYKAVQFRIQDQQDVNLDAIIQSSSSSIGVKLQDIKLESTAKATSKEMDNLVSTARQVGVKNSKQGGNLDNEESLSSEKIQSSTNYVLVIVNKEDPSQLQPATFNLRVEITEKTYRTTQDGFTEVLPQGANEVTRLKLKTEGMKESEFLIGNRYMLEYIDKNDLLPFVPKSELVYSARYKNNQGEIFQHIIPFEINEEEGEIFAVIYDYSGIANLGLSIIKESDREEFEVTSIPGKYHSYIPPVTLTKGSYQLIIEPQTYFAYQDDAILRFGLDVLYEKENITENDYELLFDSMELCGLPSFPDNLNSPQFLHPLTGYSLQFQDYYKIDEAVMGEKVTFELLENSLVTFYMELPKDINAFAELSKSKGTHKTRALTKDLNFQNDNFIRQKDLTHQNVVQLREFLSPGLYAIRVHAYELEQELSYSMPRCQAFKVGMTISPLVDSKYSGSELCTSPIGLGGKLKFDELVNGTLRYDVHTPIFDTSHIQTENQGEGPFFFYFQVSYDTQQEGPVALVLSKYDSDSLSFAEHTLYEVQDGQSLLTAVIPEGTYVISIQSLTSTNEKFISTGLGNAQRVAKLKLYNMPCIHMTYSYFVTTMNRSDVKVLKLGFMDLLSSLFGDSSNLFRKDEEQANFDRSVTNDIRAIGEASCEFDQTPTSFPNQPEGFDKTFTLKVSKKNYEVIDLINDENSLIKIFVKTRNLKNNVNVFLYQNAHLNNLISYTATKSGTKDFITPLKPQKKPYKIKLVYDTLDESDECPLFDLRVSIKPLQNLLEENLLCEGLSNAPEVINVATGDYELDQSFAISNGFLDRFDGRQDIKYDVEMNLPHPNYYFDIETKFDFLTSDIDFSLYGIDNHNANILLGRSKWINEQNTGDSGALDLASTSQSKDLVQRLRVLNTDDFLSQDQALSSKYVLSLRFSKNMYQLVQILKDKGQLISNQQSCFSFDLSVRATEVKIGNQDKKSRNQMIRIDWSTKMQNQLVDPRSKLTAFLQFQYSMEDSYKGLKFSQFVYLVPVTTEFDSSKTGTNKIYPSTTRLSTIDKSSIVVTFKHNTLERGRCYDLKIEKSQMQEKYDELLFKNQTRLCTTNCLCNQRGTKACNEKLGVCDCHYPYEGPDCSQCGFKHVLEPKTNECVKIRQCKDKGGEEDCNGHGTCEEDPQTGQAICQCDLGFVNDGIDQCAKCSDPMFNFPHCQVRNWVLEHPNINCQDLPLKMPKFLYKQSSASNDTVYQNEEGLVQWAGRYRLVGEKYLKKSTHYFMVPRNSVMRFFFDTLKSGVRVKYTVLNNRREIVFTTRDEESYMEADVLFELLPQTERENPREHPFTLEIEYQYEKAALAPGKCPLIEVYLIVQPFDKIQKHLKCSQDELNHSKQVRQFSWQLGGQKSQVISEIFTLTSDMRAGSGGYISDKNENFEVMKYQIKVEESGNALSVMATYSFEFVVLALSLVDLKTKNILAIEDVATLEDLQAGLEVDSVDDDDMVSFIEVPKLDAGEYELQILVMRSLFLPTSQFPTCISFAFTLEYIVRSISKQQAQSLTSGTPTYEVLSIIPPQLQRLKTSKKGKIDVQFNKEIELDDIVRSINDLHFVCHMENQQHRTDTINPYKVMITRADTLTLYFTFKNVKLQQDSLCYQMHCSTKDTVGKEVIRDIQFETRYCFEKESTLTDQVQCNPWAFAKVVDNRCLCTYPYTGSLCEQCQPGYIAEESNLSKGKHTVCSLDQSKCSEAVCNQHGACIKNPAYARPDDDICECEPQYTGQFCERCKNTTLAYPDCQRIRSDIYDEATDKEYLLRRRYNKGGYERYRLGDDHHHKVGPQCSWITYPQDLNKVELTGFLGGPFHVAEFYTINHDQDNLMYYTPNQQGTLKIFIQQPEAQELRVNDEIFDLEVGIYDVEKEKFLASSTNHHLNLGQAGLSGKLEYASLSLQIPFDVVNHPLIIMFRALNYSASNDESQCELVYLEVEFVEKMRECGYFEQLEKSNEVIRVSEGAAYTSVNDKKIYSLNNNKDTFFYFQDFYFDGKADSDEDYEIKISVQQKFSERNLIDFLVEVLDNDVDYYDVDRDKFRSLQKPQCNGICVISGQKAYNEFHNIIQMSSRTFFRVWLFQSVDDGSCANYQLFVEANKMKPEVSQERLANLKCNELDLPHTLNTDRYLGSSHHKGTQYNFHYLERFRVDNLQNSSTHRMDFTLTEPAVVRFTAPVHKHIEMDLELRQIMTEHGYRRNKRLVVSAAKGFEDSVFAQLDAGDYQVRLLFAAEEFFMTLPCQSIQLEIAMAPLSDAKKFLSQAPSVEQLDFSLEGIIYSPSRQLEAQRRGLIKTYSLNEQRSQKDFVSYVELYNKIFTLPDKLHSGLMITIQSDYLLNDINFVVTHLASQQVYHNTKRENLNKLVLDNLPEGEFELIIYAHHCLTNLKEDDYLKELDVKYTVDLNFVRWSTEDNFNKHFIGLKIGDQKFKAELDTIDINEFKCFQEYSLLPEDFLHFGHNEIDISQYFMIPQTSSVYTQVVTYTPLGNQDSLRIIIGRANTKIQLYRKTSTGYSNDSRKILAESYSALRGESQVLIAVDLEEGHQYEIRFEFDVIENYEEFESNVCQPFKLQVWSTSYQSMCQTDVSSRAPRELSSMMLKKLTYSHVSTLTLTASSIVQDISVQDDFIDIEVSYDFANVLFMPALKLTQGMTVKVDLTQEDIRKAASMELKPTEITQRIKNQVVYKYNKVPRGDYHFLIFQSKKPLGCVNLIQLVVKTYSPQEQTAYLDKETFGMMKQYTSALEITDLNRFVDSLPISLDTYKYLKEEQFLLISEYIQIADNQKDNIMTFTIGKNNTMLRLYVENDEIMLSLKETISGRTAYEYKTSSILGRLNEGEYELRFDFHTELSRKKALALKNKVHITLMIAEDNFYNTMYLQRQGDNLKNCEMNTNFPLALNKRSDETESEAEAVYDYPFLRLSSEVLRSKYLIDNYSFRVNDTSRFYMTMGMHMIANQVTLQLSDLKYVGIQFAGKQEGNLNVLDVTLSPGDYALTIEQTALFDKPRGQDICGIFSFFAKITPINEMTSTNGKTTQSKCEIRDVLPAKIYASEDSTKSGLEYFVNSQGTFYRAFESILYKKSRYSQYNPEFDKVAITTKEDSILSILIQFRQRGNQPLVKLYDTYAFVESDNLITSDEAEAANQILEKSYTFKVSGSHEYTLFVYYEGEVSYDQDGQEQCEYYNVILSVNHLSYLRKDFQCIDQSAEEQVSRLVDKLPRSIGDQDFTGSEFKYSSFLELRYPTDFDALGHRQDRNILLQTTDILLSDDFNLETTISFDYPFAFFGLGLLEQQIGADGKSTSIEDVSSQLAVYPKDGVAYEETLIRQIKRHGLDAQKKYLLAFSDAQSRPIFEYVANSSAKLQLDGATSSTSLCMYVKVQMSFIKQKAVEALQSGPPIIAAVSYSGQTLALDRIKNEVAITVEFSTDPAARFVDQEKKEAMIGANIDKIAQAVTLQWINQQTKQIEYAKRPIRVSKDKSNRAWTFVFDIVSEQQKKQFQQVGRLHLDLQQLTDTKGAPFKLGEGVVMPAFYMPAKQSVEQKKQENEGHTSEMQQQKTSRLEGKMYRTEVALTGKEVKCLCVHGKCDKGQALCSRCDEGWEGQLCDAKSRPTNINVREASRKKDVDQRMDTEISNSEPRSVQDHGKNIRTTKRQREDAHSPDNSHKAKLEYDSSYDHYENFFDDQKTTTQAFDTSSKSSQSERYENDSTSLMGQLYDYSVLLFIIAVLAIGGYLLANNSKKMKQYMPINLNEYEEDGDDDQAMELRDLRSKDQKAVQKNKKLGQGKQGEKAQLKQLGSEVEKKQLIKRAKLSKESSGTKQEVQKAYEEEQQEREHTKLADDLLLFAQASDQDQAQMEVSHSPESLRRQMYDEEQPQQINEMEMANEINDALKQIGDDDDEYDDDDAEMQRFF